MTNRETSELDELMLRAAHGDEAAFRAFYERSAPAILAFLTRMLPDRFQAEDVLQDAMVTAWNKAAEFDPQRAAAKTWITTIARRRAIDVLRSRKRRHSVLHDGASEIREALTATDAGAPSAPESDATALRLATCFGELSQDAASCIRFAYLEGLTFSEVAARVDRSLNTVKSWVRRGLSKLEECMQR